jgi:hypothetical protein
MESIIVNKAISSISLLCALAMNACALGADEQPSAVEGPSVPEPLRTTDAAPKAIAGTLSATVSDGQVSGKLDNQVDSVEFTSIARDNAVYEVSLTVHGMTLDATFSLDDKAASFDGFVSETGEDTQLLDEDRAALKAFYEAIQAKGGEGAPKTMDMLIRATSIWAEAGTSVPLSRRVMGEEGRGWTLLCSRLGQYVDGTHDDWSRNRWNATSSYHVMIGDYGPSTYYWTGSAWTTQGFDHANWPYEYGNCYGRCGSDCGSGHVYSQDCLDHDGCVRNGHAIASFWCDDEFTSTTDDFSFAPNCY